MASLRLGSFLLVLVHAILLLFCRVHCNEEEDNLLRGINNHRTSLKLPVLVENDMAGCLADEIADQLDDQPCKTSAETQLANYPSLLSKCNIDIKQTTEGVILPVCMPKLVPSLVLTNYTHTQYAKYINNSRYTAAGVCSEDNWMVLVLSTDDKDNLLLFLADDKDNLLRGINSYRTSLKLPVLAKNDKAECLADSFADQYLDENPCTTTNGITIVPGAETQLAKYPDLLSKCNIDINHTTIGVILPVCVPKLVPTLVLTNYTHTYAKYINDSRYTGAGVGSEDDWMVLVLSTNTPRGGYAPTNQENRQEQRPRNSWHASSNLPDDEDNLLRGINSYRTSLKLPVLTKNDKAECLADKISDQLDDKPCTTRVETQLANYPSLLPQCNIDINHPTEGVILPVCVPKLVPNLVLTNYTHTQYAKYISDSRYTGAGVDSDDNWMILVLTTNTPGGSIAGGANPGGSFAVGANPGGSFAAGANPGVSFTAGADGLVSKVGLGHCFLSLMLGLFLCLV